MTAIFHLISQKDTQLSIQLARDSKILAETAQRDANSMKMLALVTMAFLPPTAVATIFAMPFSDWGNDGSRPTVSHRFWIYWATSIPLTIITLGFWWLWICRQEGFNAKWQATRAILREQEDIKGKFQALTATLKESEGAQRRHGSAATLKTHAKELKQGGEVNEVVNQPGQNEAARNPTRRRWQDGFHWHKVPRPDVEETA